MRKAKFPHFLVLLALSGLVPFALIGCDGGDPNGDDTMETPKTEPMPPGGVSPGV